MQIGLESEVKVKIPRVIYCLLHFWGEIRRSISPKINGDVKFKENGIEVKVNK